MQKYIDDFINKFENTSEDMITILVEDATGEVSNEVNEDNSTLYGFLRAEYTDLEGNADIEKFTNELKKTLNIE